MEQYSRLKSSPISLKAIESGLNTFKAFNVIIYYIDHLKDF